ncbi:chaperonin 10-like protein, partial [Lineolata rhizophorae]
IGEYVLTSPTILGHESSGTATTVGPRVTHLRPGDRVATEPGVPCRRCSYRRQGPYHLCGAMMFAASPPHGGKLAMYFLIAANFYYRFP